MMLESIKHTKESVELIFVVYLKLCEHNNVILFVHFMSHCVCVCVYVCAGIHAFETLRRRKKGQGERDRGRFHNILLLVEMYNAESIAQLILMHLCVLKQSNHPLER